MSFWMAFISVLAIVGIIIAGGVLFAICGKIILSLFSKETQEEANNLNNQVVSKDYSIENQSALEVNKTVNQEVSNDYNHALDVDDEAAKTEEKQLNEELENKTDDDFFKDFSGDEDNRFGDDDLMGMIDEISNGVLDEEESANAEQEKIKDEENKSILDNYSIDNYFDEEDEEEPETNVEEDKELDEDIEEEPILETEEEPEEIVEEKPVVNKMSVDDEDVGVVEHIVDEATMEEINALKEEVKGIIEAMEQDKNDNKTFNEQLISILNELKEANKEKQIETDKDAEKEIENLRIQLEESRQEVERQAKEKAEQEDAERRKIMQQQLENSNAEIENLKAQLAELLRKMDSEDEGEEVKPTTKEDGEISALRLEVKEMLDTMREETDARNNEFNSQLIEILNEMKEANLNKSKEVKVETTEEAIDEVDEWKNRLEEAQNEMQKSFNEQLLHKDEETKAQLQAQKDEYNAEIEELKGQLNSILNAFKEEKENSKNENQALIDELEKERQERIKLEQDKLEAEKAEQEKLAQLEALRQENEKLSDMLHNRETSSYEPLTKDEEDDLYSEATTIDYSAIKKMYDEEVTEKVKQGFEESKAEIDELKEQISRLTAFMQEREEKLAGQINVHEVRTPEFDIDKIKEITAKEVEAKVKEKLSESLDEVNDLRKELEETKKELERQYKEQLANKEETMEYEVINHLQASAEEIEEIKRKLSELATDIKKEQSEAKATSKECVSEFESNRESKVEEAKQQLAEMDADQDVAIIGPKNNTVALISSDVVASEDISSIDMETVKKLTEAEIDEIISKRLSDSNKEIESLKEQLENLKASLDKKDDEGDGEPQSNIPVVRSPLFDVEAIKTITAQEVETKVQERLAEAMKEIEEMKKQLEVSKQEIERQYKEQLNSKSEELEYEMRARLKSSAAEVVELKEQLADVVEQLELERQEAKNNSVNIAEQLEQERKAKEEIARQQLTEFSSSNNNMAVATREVTVIGPKNNQIALVTNNDAVTSEEVELDDDIPTIDIETVKKLTEQEIEEKVEQRLTSSTIEIEELKKQILNLSIQLQEVKDKPADDGQAEKPVVFHYSTEEAYLERLAILDERLKVAKKDLKINNKELNPLEKVKRTLERDKAKLRRKDAIVAKKKVALYGVNNYVDIDKEKAEKLKQELELLDGLRLSVSHCEEVMNANIDRYPILVHTNQILRENIANIESDIATLNKELQLLREKNSK